MSIAKVITKFAKQTATYWGNPIKDGFGGYTFDAPVTINCRWTLKQDLFIDARGKEKVSAAIVLVLQDVDIGGYLYLGTSIESSPKDVGGSYEIKGFEKIPDLKAVSFLRKVFL